MNLKACVALLFTAGIALSAFSGCGSGEYKCTFEKKANDGTWEKRCETFNEEDVIDLDTYCDKYDGAKTHSVRPSETTYTTSSEYPNPELDSGVCESADGREF